MFCYILYAGTEGRLGGNGGNARCGAGIHRGTLRLLHRLFLKKEKYGILVLIDKSVNIRKEEMLNYLN